MKFDYCRLGDIADITKLAGFEFTKFIEYVDDGEIIALRALNLRNGELDLTDIKRIKKNVSDNLVRSKVFANDILLTYTGNSYGDCAIVTENDKYHLAPNICKITPKVSMVNPYFLYLYVRSKAFKLTMGSYIGGSSQPTIPMKTLRILEVPYPKIDIQNKIVQIVYNIDEKIRVNNLINKNLADQAREVFEDNFIGISELPTGWKEGSLTTIADYLNGLAMQKFRPKDNEEKLPVLKIKELRQGLCDENSELCSANIKPEYIINDGDVIFSWSGSLLVDFWCGGRCGLNQHLFKVSSEKYAKWLYYSWTKYYLQEFIFMAADKATTMGHIKRDALEKARILIPNQDDYIRIGNLLQPMYDKIISNQVENRKLTNLRNTLLTRLMCGEIDVSDIEI